MRIGFAINVAFKNRRRVLNAQIKQQETSFQHPRIKLVAIAESAIRRTFFSHIVCKILCNNNNNSEKNEQIEKNEKKIRRVRSIKNKSTV